MFWDFFEAIYLDLVFLMTKQQALVMKFIYFLFFENMNKANR